MAPEVLRKEADNDARSEWWQTSFGHFAWELLDIRIVCNEVLCH